MFDRTKLDNKYHDYTIVHAMYCSGDVWGGNVTRPYTDPNGKLVQQRGMLNTLATINWVMDQQAKGYLASTLSSLVVMGCSAGSIGAQLWGNYIIGSLKWKNSAGTLDTRKDMKYSTYI